MENIKTASRIEDQVWFNADFQIEDAVGFFSGRRVALELYHMLRSEVFDSVKNELTCREL
jgi:hypothetical protein